MELKDRIMQNALILFSRNGIKSVTMADIAQDMGISKRTLYEVFKDKEDLLESCLNAHFNKECEDIEKITGASCNIIETLLHFHSQELNNFWSIGRSLIRDLKKYHRNIYDQMEKRQKEDMYMFISLFNRGVEEGYIRNDIPLDILLWLLKQQFMFLMLEDEIPIDKYSIDDYFNALILNFLRGISTLRGLEKIEEIVNKIKRV